MKTISLYQILIFKIRLKMVFFAIRWQAHSLSYGIPKDIEDELKKGINVIF